MSRWAVLLVAQAFCALAPAEAAEYRLQVVSLYEESFTYYLDPGGPTGSHLSRLDSALDRQAIPNGIVLYERWIEPADASLARAFGATPVKAELVAGREPFLPEFRWQGEPGQRTLWVVKARSFHLHELGQLGLKGGGPLRHVIPYGAALKVKSGQAVSLPANLIDFSNGRPELWDRWLARYLDMRDGIAAVVGVEPNLSWPDRVYLLIEQPAESRTFKAVLGWRPRLGVEENLFQLGGDVSTN